MKKKVVVIIGAGLSGSIIFHKLKPFFNIKIVTSNSDIQTYGKNYTCKLKRSIGSGLGGTTKYWHNALIKIDKRYLNFDWLKETGVDKYYNDVAKLFKLKIKNDKIKKNYLGEKLYVPNKRYNVWKYLKNDISEVIYDEVISIIKIKKQIKSVKCKSGRVINGDIFIDCSGGIGSIKHLSKYFKKRNNFSIGYEDHLCVNIGLISGTLNTKLYSKVNNSWTNRVALVGKFKDNRPVAYYLRPTIKKLKKNLYSSKSNLSQLRNGPKRFLAALKVLTNPTDIIDGIYSKFGKMIKSNTHEIFCVFSSIGSEGRARIEGDKVFLNVSRIKNYLPQVENIFKKIIHKEINNPSFIFYKNWKNDLDTGAHHSSTFPISKKGEYFNFKFCLNGVNNYYGASGAVIPDSAYCNTGFTIAAIALKISNGIIKRYNEK